MLHAIKEFELIIDTSPEDFGIWLISESYELFNKPFLRDENNWATLHSPKFYEPSEDWPHHRFTLNATIHEEFEFEPGDLSKFRRMVESVILLDIRVINRNKIHVIGYWTEAPFSVQLEQLFKKIILLYNPKIIEDPESHWRRLIRPEMESLPVLIFDCVITTTPTSLLNWIHAEVTKLIPDKLSKIIPKYVPDKGFSIQPDNTTVSPNGELFINPEGAIIPPEDEFPYRYFSIVGLLSKLTDLGWIRSGTKVLAGIEIRELTENQIQVIGKCTNIPIVLDLVESLLSDIIRVFKPEFEESKINQVHIPHNNEQSFNDRGQQLTSNKKREPGRPHFSEDIWAHQQVNKLGRDPKEVKTEWLDMVNKNPERVNNLPQSNERHFKKIIKSNWLD